MKELIIDLLKKNGVNPQLSQYIGYFTLICIVILVAVLADLISKKVILIAVEKLVKKTKNRFDDIFMEKKGFHYLSQIAPAIVIYLSAGMFPLIKTGLHKLSLIYLITITIIILFKLMESIEEVYSSLSISRERPIKGYVQVFQMIATIIGGIMIISNLMNKSPWKLLSGIGAVTAIVLLIFKDSILGFVAGIQLAANNMIRIGDWIEMPKYNADGDVIEINLTTVKVRNFDKTITTIPVYAFISDSFKNWRGMSESGGRRIKRPIFIDATTIKICTDEMIEKYKKISYISEYMDSKSKEVDEYNKNIDTSQTANGRRLTNIGTFRNYVLSYLKNNPEINQHMTLLVRQLEITPQGLPIEIYAFSKNIEWQHYERIQSDIFDHLLAVLPEFDLKVFQNPSGNDFKSSLLGVNNQKF
jgi:miniconductance mechanosensitive channel